MPTLRDGVDNGLHPSLRAHFDRELADLTERVLAMGSRSRHAVMQSMQALSTGEPEIAREVIAGDKIINDMRFVIEKMCYGMLAMEQPVAGDMRAIVAALTMTNDLERIGDHGKRIAALSLRMGSEPRTIPIGDLTRLSALALSMLDRALAAVVSRDVLEAEAVCRMDDQADALYKQIFNVTLSYMLENTRLIGAGTYIIQVAHELERVADRATNVAERCIYAATGQLVDLNV